MTLGETESGQVVKAYNSNYLCYFSVSLKLFPNKKLIENVWKQSFSNLWTLK